MKSALLAFLAFFLMFAPAAEARKANGNNLISATYSNGIFEYNGGDQWVERTYDGNYFYFRETERNRKSITLYDGSRGVYINLDTKQWVIWTAPPGGSYRKLYDIIDMNGN